MQSILSNTGEKKLSSNDSSFTLELNRRTFMDEKEEHKFIRKVEYLIRQSMEYKEWVDYIKHVLGSYTCKFTGEIETEVTIDIHHHPIDLYTICKTVIQNIIHKKENFNTLIIAEKVLNLHFENRVGYIPLIRTLHEKYHNGFLRIPISLVQGDYQFLLDNLDFDIEDKSQILSKMKCKDKVENLVDWSRDIYPKAV